jgi:hypothetical protein
VTDIASFEQKPLRRVMISHGRCGTHWLKRLISDALGAPPLDEKLLEVERLKRALEEDADRRLIYEHFSFDVHSSLLDPAADPRLRLVLLHRHPLDFFISATWFRINVRKVLASPEPGVDHSEVARGMLLGNYDETLGEDYGKTFAEFQEQRVVRWVESKRCHLVKYEDLVERTEEVLKRCLDHLEIRFRDEDIPNIIARHGFESLSGGRPRGETDGSHHYRKGQPGEWRSVFRPEDLPALRERYGDLFARQGYPI